MRCVVDECIDAAVVGSFVRAGHDAWTVPAAGLAGEDDDEVSVYAHDKGAVLVTDDDALIRRRRANLFGKTLRLVGHKVDHVAIVAAFADQIAAALASVDEVVVAASPGRRVD